MNARTTSRRQFLLASGRTMGWAWLASQWPQVVAAAEHAHQTATTDTADRTRFLLLTQAQARDVEAIAAQIVPSGATPGAREAGVVYFVDQIHAGHWKSHAGEFIGALTDFQAKCARHHPGTAQFADLGFEEQTAYLQHMEHTSFFQRMRFLTVVGLLALPSYGGNAQKLGWQMVGFNDQHAWMPPFGWYDADYKGFEPYPGHTPYSAAPGDKS